MSARVPAKGKAALAAAAIAAAALSGIASCAPKARAAIVPYDYASWRRTTEVRLDYPVPGHEDRFRVIYMNERGFAAAPAADGRLEFPAGTMIAKEVFASSKPGPDDKPIMITAMVKAPDDPDSKGGWLWVAKDLASGAENVGAGDFCARCHANANEKHPYGDTNPAGAFSDYVFFVPPAMRPAPGDASAAGASGGEASGQSQPSAAAAGAAAAEPAEGGPASSAAGVPDGSSQGGAQGAPSASGY